MNVTSLLTIIVPTYNRSTQLENLLGELSRQLETIEGRVEVVVGNNCSTDNTTTVIRTFQAGFPDARILHHDVNLGADENFCRCLETVTTKYFWIIGDDDLPKSGVIAKVLQLLDDEGPDLAYLQSEWVNPVTGPEQGARVNKLKVEFLDRQAFARKVHVWFTFISGVIVNREQLLRGLKSHTVRRYTGTNLVQLGWILPVLESGTRFAFVADRCMLATKDNSGGYALLTVFGVNFPRIAREAFGEDSPLARALISRTAGQYLPGLFWSGRTRARSRFAPETPWPALRQALAQEPVYWAVLVPLGKWPVGAAFVVRQAWRVVVVAGRVFDRLGSILRRSAPAR